MTERRRERPEAFRLDDPRIVMDAQSETVETFNDATADEAPATRVAEKRFSWGPVFWTAAGVLVSLAIGLGIDALVRDLYARAQWLGWFGVAAALLLVFAVIGIAAREIAGLFRLARVHRLRREAEVALLEDDPKAARKTIGALTALYVDRPETARGRRALDAQKREIMDAADLLAIAERELLGAYDEEARRMVMESARRVSIVTAVSPRAVLDLAFVFVESIRLVRRLSMLYGGRPGGLGLLRLMREVVALLAATGAIALGDSLVQQILGHGVAARLSARLGEGVVNGLLTARVGLAAILVCRPMPFIRAKPARISDVMAELVKVGGGKAAG